MKESKMANSILNKNIQFISKTVQEFVDKLSSPEEKQQWERLLDDKPTTPNQNQQNEQSFIENFLHSKRSNQENGNNRSLLYSILFGGQFRKITKFEDKQPEIDLSSIIQNTLVSKITKKFEKEIKKPPIFIDFETEQLELDDSMFQQILDEIVNPPSREDQIKASIILIQVSEFYIY